MALPAVTEAPHEPQTRTRWHARGKEGDNKKSVEVGELLQSLVTLQHVARRRSRPPRELRLPEIMLGLPRGPHKTRWPQRGRVKLWKSLGIISPDLTAAITSYADYEASQAQFLVV